MLDKTQQLFEFASYDRKFRSKICLRHEIKSADLLNIRPCTAVQTGMLASFLTSKGAAYFNSLEMRVPERKQICDRLRRAWSNVAAKHEILRTGFTNVDDAEYPFAMLTYQPGVFDVELEIKEESIDGTDHLRGRTKLISEAVLQSLHHPPWRVELIIRKENIFALQVFMHHSLFDAHSMKLILRDVKKHYQGEELSPTTSLGLLLSSIILESSNDQEIKEIFWRDSICKSAVGKFPNMTTLKVRSTKTYALEKCCGMPLSEIQARCRNIGVTFQAAGQACWARVLSSYIGEASVIFGTGALDGCHRMHFLTLR
jgi:ferricrocin synthase